MINPFNFQKGPLTARRKKINLSCVFSFEIIRHIVIIISRKVFSKVKNHLSENTQIIQWLKCPLTNFSYYVSLKNLKQNDYERIKCTKILDRILDILDK